MNMDTQNVRSVAAKDFETVRRKRSIMISILVLPLLGSIAFSLYVANQVQQWPQTGVPTTLAVGFEWVMYFFIIIASVLPSSLAAYSIVGEKVEKSLEPLLATPMTDGEILLGKGIAAFVPPMLATWAGAALFMIVADLLTHNGLSYYYFPDWVSGVMLLLLAPLAAVMSIELTVIVSSRVSDVRGATQIGSLMFIPFMAIFVAYIDGVFSFDVDTLLLISAIVLVVDVILGFLSISTFRREEMLTKWK